MSKIWFLHVLLLTAARREAPVAGVEQKWKNDETFLIMIINDGEFPHVLFSQLSSCCFCKFNRGKTVGVNHRWKKNCTFCEVHNKSRNYHACCVCCNVPHTSHCQALLLAATPTSLIQLLAHLQMNPERRRHGRVQTTRGGNEKQEKENKTHHSSQMLL